MSLKSEEIANPDGCLSKAADDEPIFVLRANDPVAAGIVRRWADDYLIDKRENSTDGCLTHKQLSKAQEARGLANEMDSWRDYHDLGSFTGKPTRSVLEVVQRRARFWKFVATILAAASLGNLIAALIAWAAP